MEEYQDIQNIQDIQAVQAYQPDPMMFTMWGVVYVAIIVIVIASMWKIFTKAGKPGWASIIPVYNLYVFLQIIGRPGWWLLLYFIPFVNFVISLINAMDLAKAFGKSSGYGIVMLWLFAIIGYPALAFGKSTYTKAPAKPSTPTPAATETPAKTS